MILPNMLKSWSDVDKAAVVRFEAVFCSADALLYTLLDGCSGDSLAAHLQFLSGCTRHGDSEPKQRVGYDRDGEQDTEDSSHGADSRNDCNQHGQRQWQQET